MVGMGSLIETKPTHPCPIPHLVMCWLRRTPPLPSLIHSNNQERRAQGKLKLSKAIVGGKQQEKKSKEKRVVLEELKSPETAKYRRLFVAADHESRPPFTKAARLSSAAQIFHLQTA
ncbi:unnamed protein product [Cuscuta epithymum]|uniref:Uncharacterized protein n=1 Tax=Cuscuta epithymum TaxID=186058 RepID=A0AAV0CI70_9ASTE|nr:unnamed protein product [Cuscuta epithymum]